MGIVVVVGGREGVERIDRPMEPSHVYICVYKQGPATHQHAPPAGVVRVGVRGHGLEALAVGEPGQGPIVPRPPVQVL